MTVSNKRKRTLHKVRYFFGVPILLTHFVAMGMFVFLAVQKIRRAASERWGGSMELPPATSWRGKKYLPWKLRKIRFPLTHSDDLESLAIPLAALQTMDVYASAVTWYGEESPLTRLSN